MKQCFTAQYDDPKFNPIFNSHVKYARSQNSYQNQYTSKNMDLSRSAPFLNVRLFFWFNSEFYDRGKILI